MWSSVAGAYEPGGKWNVASPLPHGLGRQSCRAKLFLSAETTAHGRDETHAINNTQSAAGRELLHVRSRHGEQQAVLWGEV